MVTLGNLFTVEAGAKEIFFVEGGTFVVTTGVGAGAIVGAGRATGAGAVVTTGAGAAGRRIDRGAVGAGAGRVTGTGAGAGAFRAVVGL